MKTICGGSRYEFLRRIRKPSFLILTFFAVLCAWFMVPNPELPVTSIVVEPAHFSQISDATWIPMAAAICTGIFLPLVGVLYCKNTLTEDARSGIFSLVRITPIRSFSFVMHRFLANLEIMISILAVVMLGSWVMVCVLFSPGSMTGFAFFTPFAAVIPGIVFSAAAAIFLDSISLRFPRNGNFAGLLVFLILYLLVLSVSVISVGNHAVWMDITGIQWIIDSISHTVFPVTGKPADITILAGGDAIQNSAELPALVFRGIDLSAKFVCQKIILCIVSIFLVFLASLVLPEYLPERAGKKQAKAKKKKEFRKQKTKAPYAGKIRIQFRLYFGNLPGIWRVVLAGLFCLEIFVPLKSAEDMVIPLTAGWSFLLFSRLGCMEHVYRMVPQLLCLPGGYVRQLRNGLVCGILYAAVITLPVSVRCCLAGEFTGLTAIVALVLLLPSLSLLLGDLTRGPRLTEIVLLVICFLMLNQPSLIVGISPEYYAPGRTICVCALAAGFLAAAFLKRILGQRTSH